MNSAVACSPLKRGSTFSKALVVVASKDLAISLLDSIPDAEVIEQPLVAVTSIRMGLEAVALLLSVALRAPVTSLACIRISTAPLRHPRHAELAWADLDVFAVQCTAGVGVQTGELR